MLEPITSEHIVSENNSLTTQSVNAEQPAVAKINLLDLNRQQLREFFRQNGRETLPCRSGHEVDVPLLL
ncbi:Uncharacterised protein [Serratia quinivorans]|uniref:Uncharacterized protein n=1 Tax=Serratia quinivorans TaxID=137545 RepID=A0A380A7X5_9GAMM|nr:Uncharacterised protein [Serratia quinivorans]